MIKAVTGLFAALVAALLLVGSTANASAHYRHYGYGGYGHHHSCCGGPVHPTYIYHTANKVTHVTRYRDESRTNYVYRTHRIVHVTRIRPIIYVHTVTRVHHHTVSVLRPVYVHETQYLPPERISTGSVFNTSDCRCGYHHCH